MSRDPNSSVQGSQVITVVLAALVLYTLSYIWFRERNRLGIQDTSDIILVDSKQKKILLVLYTPLFHIDHNITDLSQVPTTY